VILLEPTVVLPTTMLLELIVVLPTLNVLAVIVVLPLVTFPVEVTTLLTLDNVWFILVQDLKVAL
jgi:hypothetical protein